MSTIDMKGMKSPEPNDVSISVEGSAVGDLALSSENEEIIFIEPEKEKAALRKFDIWLVPVAFAFLVLSSLDRSNVRRNPWVTL
jgi:hypothetical protein